MSSSSPTNADPVDLWVDVPVGAAVTLGRRCAAVEAGRAAVDEATRSVAGRRRGGRGRVSGAGDGQRRSSDGSRGRRRLVVGGDERRAVEHVDAVVRARRAPDVHERHHGATVMTRLHRITAPHQPHALYLTVSTRTHTTSIELMSYVPLNRKQDISETFFVVNFLLSSLVLKKHPSHVVQWSNHLGAMCSRA